MTDFGTLKIGEVILHRVPRGRRSEDGPDEIEYSEAPIQLRPVDRDFIQLRLRETLGGRARPVIEDDDASSNTPGLIRQLVAASTELVAHSSELARRLHQRQKWMSSIGLLMVFTGELDGEPCLVIAKMEHEEGMRVELTETADGKKTYRAQYLRDLILGEGTKVFKVGVFKASGAQEGSKLRGEVVDVQQGGGQVAEYFVEFLGCGFVQRADVQTQTFFKATQSFINRATKDNPETTAAYEIALLSELQGRTTTINAEQFARQHLHDDHQDDYIAHLTSAGVAVRGFNKNTALIESHIRRVKIQTERGATILVPPSMYDDGAVSVTNGEGSDGQTITVRDTITGVAGASGPKVTDDDDDQG